MPTTPSEFEFRDDKEKSAFDRNIQTHFDARQWSSVPVEYTSTAKEVHRVTATVVPKGFSVETYLGGGAYGKVFKVLTEHPDHPGSHIPYAMKVMTIANPSAPEFASLPPAQQRVLLQRTKLQLREVEALMHIRKQQIQAKETKHVMPIRLLFVPKFDTVRSNPTVFSKAEPWNSFVCVFLDLQHNDIGRILKTGKRTPLLCRRSVVETLLIGIHVMHMCSLIHRDLKPANVLVSRKWVSSICDFGMTRNVPRTEFIETYLKDRTTPAYLPFESCFDERSTARPDQSEAEIDLAAARQRDYWAVGLIWAELILHEYACVKREMDVRDAKDVAHAIVRLVGHPSEADLQSLAAEQADRIRTWSTKLGVDRHPCGTLRGRLEQACVGEDPAKEYTAKVAALQAKEAEIKSLEAQGADTTAVATAAAAVAQLRRHARLLKKPVADEIDEVLALLSLTPAKRTDPVMVLHRMFQVKDDDLLYETDSTLGELSNDAMGELTAMLAAMGTVTSL